MDIIEQPEPSVERVEAARREVSAAVSAASNAKRDAVEALCNAIRAEMDVPSAFLKLREEELRLSEGFGTADFSTEGEKQWQRDCKEVRQATEVLRGLLSTADKTITRALRGSAIQRFLSS